MDKDQIGTDQSRAWLALSSRFDGDRRERPLEWGEPKSGRLNETEQKYDPKKVISHSGLKMLGVLMLVLSAASGGLAVTAQFTESSVTSDVTVQIDRQFVVPQFESINQTDIRESKGSQSLLRTQNGTTLRVIEENVTADSITVTVPIENNGTNRRTTRLSVASSTTPFRIDTETISQSFANNSTFARTVNHTLASDTDAFVELPSTVGDEPRAVNVTVSYNKTPASPLTAAFRLSPTEGRIDVQPDSQLNGSGGSGSGSGGGGTSNDLLAPGSQTVVTGGLTLVNENGTDSDTVVVTDNVDVLGPPADLDGDGRSEQPFTNASGVLKTVEVINTTTGPQKQNETTLVPAGASVTPRTSKSTMTTAQFNGSTLSTFFATESDELFRVNSSGDVTKVSQTGVQALSTVGDIDGDGTNELVFADTSQNLKYLEPDGTVKSLQVAAGSNNGVGIGVGELFDVDGDSADGVLFVGSSNNVKVIDANDNGTATSLTQSGPAEKSAVTATDVDGDNTREVLFLDSSDNINYVDDVGGANQVRPLVNATGAPVTGSRDVGLTSR